MNSQYNHIRFAFDEARTLLEDITIADCEAIDEMADILIACFKAGGKVLVCGNGGSACDAMHFAEELTGRYQKDRKALPAIALTDAAHMSCVGNDYGFEYVFSRAVEALGKPGDVLVALSTSGNSHNILRGVYKAKDMGIEIISLLGKGGGDLARQGDTELIVPSHDTARIQEVHMLVLHILVEAIEREMFPENYA